MIKLTMVLALAAGALAFVPQPVAAAGCTQGYVQCLNDTWYYEGTLQEMADLECSTSYAGCVAKKWFGF